MGVIKLLRWGRLPKVISIVLVLALTMTNTIKIVEKDELDAYDDDEEDDKDDGVDETTKSYFSFAFGKNSLQD